MNGVVHSKDSTDATEILMICFVSVSVGRVILSEKLALMKSDPVLIRCLFQIFSLSVKI
jgi:hypothetical protein